LIFGNGAKNLHFRMANVQKIVSEKKYLITNNSKLKYDYLIIATGSQSNFFGFTPDKDKLMPLKTIPHALNMRSYNLQNFETAISIRLDVCPHISASWL